MRYYQYIYTFFSLLISFNVFAQKENEILIDPILIHLKGVLISSADSLPIPYAHVVNLRTHGGTTTNAEGRFSIQMLNVDSLRISALGYMREWIAIPSNQNKDSILVVSIRPVRYAIGEVVVRGKSPTPSNLGELGTGKPVDISPELRGDAFNEKPPWYASIFAPASFLQYHLSRREKEKRMAREAMISEKDWEHLSQLYNLKMVEEITGLTGDAADNFMIWFNSKSLLNARSNEYDVRAAITQQYKIYTAEKNEKQNRQE